MKRKACVQRKFAQGAHIPSNHQNTITTRTEVQAEPIKPNIIHNNSSAKSLLDLVAFNSIHIHRQPVVLLERLEDQIIEPNANANAAPNEPEPVNNGTSPTTAARKTRSNSLPKNSSMCLRSKAKRKPKTNTKRKHGDSDDDETPLEYYRGNPKINIEPLGQSSPAKQKRLSDPADPNLSPTSDSTSQLTANHPAPEQQHLPATVASRRRIGTPCSNPTTTQPPVDHPIQEEQHLPAIGASTRRIVQYQESTSKSTYDAIVQKTDYQSANEKLHSPASVASRRRVEIRCPIENRRNLRDAYYAPTYVKDRFCNSCSSCKRLLKLDELSKLMRIPHDLNDDVYEFDAEREASESLPLAYRKRGKKQTIEILESSHEKSKYFDFMPPEHSNYVLKLRLVQVPDKEKQTIIRASVVPRTQNTQTEDIYLVENEELVDGLIRFMIETVTKPLSCEVPHSRIVQNEVANRKPSRIPMRQELLGRIPVRNEAPTENRRTASCRHNNPGLNDRQKKAPTVNNKSKPCQHNRGTSGPRTGASTATSKPTGASYTKKTQSSKSLQKETELVSSKPTKTFNSQNTAGPSGLQDKAPGLISKPTNTLNPQSERRESVDTVISIGSSSPIKETNNGQLTQSASSTRAKSNIQVKSTTKELKNMMVLPKSLTSGEVVEAPTFYLSETECCDPIAFFEKIKPYVGKFGICKVVAPKSFKPTCLHSEEIKFNVTNQYIARLYSRWGPAAREMTAIKAYLATQNVQFSRAPMREGLELNLPKLYHIVQRNGGLQQVMDMKRWSRVAEEMKLTKCSDPEKTLDEIYIKYLVPYDMLSNQERQQIMKSVEKFWNKKNQKLLDWANNPLHRQKKLLGESDSESSDDDYEDAKESPEVATALKKAEDCVMQGRLMNLSSFKKVATKAMAVNFPDSSTTREVESEYWRLVLLGTEHVCVNSASIDAGDGRFGFSTNETDACCRHPWNLKMLSQNQQNVLSPLGPVLGVTLPTFHLGMAFSTSCWHRDPHMLPWVEYLHNGATKIWYGIPNEQSANFRKAVETLCPTSCQNKSIWLPSDITMIPPNLLREHHVSLSRVEQKPGEFVIVLPMAYSCSISTGYTESESVYFATKSWTKTMHQVFQELRDSCEPTTFSLEQLLIALARDSSVPLSVLQQVHASLSTIVDEERRNRDRLTKLGVQSRIINLARRPGTWNVREQHECEICRTTLYLSMVFGLIGRKSSVCLQHALRLLEMPKYKDHDVSKLEMIIFYTKDKLMDIISDVQTRLSH